MLFIGHFTVLLFLKIKKVFKARVTLLALYSLSTFCRISQLHLQKDNHYRYIKNDSNLERSPYFLCRYTEGRRAFSSLGAPGDPFNHPLLASQLDGCPILYFLTRRGPSDSEGEEILTPKQEEGCNFEPPLLLPTLIGSNSKIKIYQVDEPYTAHNHR